MSSKTSPNNLDRGCKSNMHQLKRRLTAGLEWLNNHIDCFTPLQAGELSEAGIKALAELAIAYAWLEDCRSRTSPLANFSPLQKSFELWRTFISRECEEMSYAQSARRRPAQAFCLLSPYLALRPSG